MVDDAMVDRQIRIVTGMSGVTDHAINFETGASPAEVRDLSLFAFEHHGEGFDPIGSPSALRQFHERMMMGQAMPPVLLLTRWWRIDQVLAATLFIIPSLILEPMCSHLVQSFDLTERLGPSATAHIPWEHREVIRLVRDITSSKDHSQVSSQEALGLIVEASQIILAYLVRGTLPSMAPPPQIEVLVEREGFLAFRAGDWAWDMVWAEGALWGLWVNAEHPELRIKSPLVSINPEAVSARLTKKWTQTREGVWVHEGPLERWEDVLSVLGLG